MRSFNYLSALIAFVLFANFSLHATTYYLDASQGDNQNSGLSPTLAWKDSIMQSILPSDKIFFKRGEVWKRRWYSSSAGTFSQPIVYSAYGDLNDPLPIISGVLPLTVANDISNWNLQSNNIWTLDLPKTPGRLFLDDLEVLRARSLVEVGLNDSEGFLGRWFHFDSVLYLHSPQNPALEYQLFEGSQDFITFTLEKADYNVLQNLDIQGGSGASVMIAGAEGIEVKYCRLGNKGRSGILLRTSAQTSSSKISIHDNIFDSKFQFLHGLGTDRGCGDGVRIIWGVDSSEVFRNIFKNWAHNAIELLGNQDTLDGVNYNLFYDNYIHAPDIPYAHPLGADGFIGKCQFNEFYRNTIENCRTASQINGNNNWVHHNLINGMLRSLAKDEPTAHAFILGVYGTNLVSQDNRFEHNTIMDTDESGFLVSGYGFNNQVKDNLIQNNIIYETGKAPHNNAYNIGTSLVIFDTNTDGLDGNTYRNNLFYNSEPTYQAVFVKDDSAYYSADQFNIRNGIDKDTISDNLDSDPLFIDFNMDNYRLSSTSLAIDVGISTNTATDYLLNNRTLGISPDIGAIEYNPDCFDSLILHNYPIMNAAYEAQDHIESMGFIKNDGIISFQAGTSIVLKAGFQAKKGSQFVASISTCNNQNLGHQQENFVESRTVFSDQLTLSMQPNPIRVNSNFEVQFHLSEASTVCFTIYRSDGKPIHSTTLTFENKGLHRHTFSNLNLAAGAYYFNLKNKEKHITKLLIVN